MIKRNIYGAVAVLNIEDDGITAGLAPAPYDLDSVITASHQASQVNRTDFKVLGNGNRLFGYRRVQYSRNCKLLSRFYKRAVHIGIHATNRFSQFRRSQIRSLRKVVP